MPPRLTENPWFWLMLFGSLGAVGVVVIGPKYAARTARMERMAETRERVKAAKELGVSATEVQKVRPGEVAGPAGGTASGSSPETGPIEPYVEADFRRPPQLDWLLGLMIVLMAAGTTGMILSRRRHRA